MKLGLSSFVGILVLGAPLLASAQSTPDAPAAAAAPPLPAPAPAPTDDGAPETPVARRSGPPRYDYLRFGLGFRISDVGSRGFDTFADTDTLAQVSLDASYAFLTKGKFALAGGVAWDVGSRTSGARGLTTRLTAHRLTVPIEGRYYLAPWVNVFAKVAPGAAAFHARIEDPSSPATLEHAPWVFAADLSAGATVRIAGSTSDRRQPRLWINAELGYGLTSSRTLRPGSDRDEDDVLGSDARMRLGSLAMNGVFWRTGLALSF